MATTNTGSALDVGTNTGLSTQIIVKVNGVVVGAMQKFSLTQTRDIKSIQEIGTDGIIELVPNKGTTFKVSCDRLVFDNMHLPEAFGRGFRFINAQRVPFDIEVHDFSTATAQTVGTTVGTTGTGTGTGVGDTGYTATSTSGSTVMVIKNCWFDSCSMPLASDDYTILQVASLSAETAYLALGTSGGATAKTGASDSKTAAYALESSINKGARRGSMDVYGLYVDRANL